MNKNLKMITLVAAVAMAVIVYFTWPILHPAPYECAWKEIAASRSPSGNKVGLIYETSCANGGMTTFAMHTVFEVNALERGSFTPSEKDSRLRFSREASSRVPEMKWQGEKLIVQ